MAEAEKVAKKGKVQSKTPKEESGVVAPAGSGDFPVVSRHEYERLKIRAIKFENKNDKFVLVLPCNGDSGWHELCENSALIYKYLVCMPLGRPATLADDFDSHYVQYSIGRVRTRGTDTVRKRLRQAGLYADETEKDGCVIFELNRRIGKEEMDKLRDEEMQRQSALNSVVKVKDSDPVLHQKMVEVATRLHRICFRRLDKLSSATNGARMVERADEMLRIYYRMGSEASDAVERAESWRQMLAAARQLLVELQIVAGLKLWTREDCVRIAEQVEVLIARIEWDVKHEAGRSSKRNSPREAGGAEKVATNQTDGGVRGGQEGEAKNV